MPDEILEQRDGVLRTIRRAIAAHEGLTGALFPGQQLTPGTGLGEAEGEAGPADNFATGFDAGTGQTTVAFLFDYSAMDGGDLLI